MTTLTKKMAEDLTSYLQGGSIGCGTCTMTWTPLSGWRSSGTSAWAPLTCWWASTSSGRGWTCPRSPWWPSWMRTRRAFSARRHLLIQTIGRAARKRPGPGHLCRPVTPSMAAAMEETQRRREIQKRLQPGPRHCPQDHCQIGPGPDRDLPPPTARRGREGAKALTPQGEGQPHRPVGTGDEGRPAAGWSSRPLPFCGIKS